MRLLDRLLRRVEGRANAPHVEDGFVHAPDLAPEDVGRLERKGWSGQLPDHGMHATPPSGWKHLVAGFGVLPSVNGEHADPSGGDDHAEDAGGADYGRGSGESSGGG